MFAFVVVCFPHTWTACVCGSSFDGTGTISYRESTSCLPEIFIWDCLFDFSCFNFHGGVTTHGHFQRCFSCEAISIWPAQRRRGSRLSSKPLAQRWLPECVIGMEQSKAKTYLPPGDCHIWKSRGANIRNTRNAQMPTCRRSVVPHVEESALKQVITSAWRHWCLLEGVPEDECPCKGLVQDAELDG